jgi:hypothetical protein
MTILKRVSTLLLLLVAATNAVWFPITLSQHFQEHLFTQDTNSYFDQAYGPVRERLLRSGLSELGYMTEPGAAWEDKASTFYIVQYSLAPVVLIPHSPRKSWALVDYSAVGSPFPIDGMDRVADFGEGLALYHVPTRPMRSGIAELGKTWDEHEGEFRGVWTRRGSTDTFDAVWVGPHGSRIVDEIRFESLVGREITLYRVGTRGRYYGTLSASGTTIENGRADWFSTGDSWSAKITQ